MRRAGQRGLTILEMMIVVTVVALLAGLTFPSISSGLDSLKMRSATDSVAALLTDAITKAERTQQPVEITIFLGESRLSGRGVRPEVQREMRLPEGISVVRVLPPENGEPSPTRSVLLIPGATVPGFGIELANKRGLRRLVRIDPLAGVPVIESPGSNPANPEEEK